MSVRAMSWVFDHSPVDNSGDLLVLLVLADHCRDDGAGAYPSVENIGRKARLSRAGVYASLARLKGSGAIVADGVGPRRTVSYRLVMQDTLEAPDALLVDDLRHAEADAILNGPRVQDLDPSRAWTVQDSENEGPRPGPKPSLTTQASMDSPGRARRKRTSPTSSGEEESAEAVARRLKLNRRPAKEAEGLDRLDPDGLAAMVCGVLARGVDSVTGDGPCKRPTPHGVRRVLEGRAVTPDEAFAAAVEARSIVQSQNRAPNIVALYEQRLNALPATPTPEVPNAD